MPLERSRELVLKKLRQSFPNERTAAEALQLLDSYAGDTPKARARVQLVILMQCGGDLARLRVLVGVAQEDYRDVLVGAEYPEQFRASSKAPPEELTEIR